MTIKAGENPHTSKAAIVNSCYTKPRDDALALVESGEAAPPLAARVHAALRALILDPEYPCVGSRSALNQGSYRFAMYDELGTPEATAGLARDLFTFVAEQPSIEGEFTTFIACFDKPKALSPEEWEESLWRQLKMLSELDTEEWAEDYSRDAGHNRFAFSFAGRAFFVVGLSRPVSAGHGRFPGRYWRSMPTSSSSNSGKKGVSPGSGTQCVNVTRR